MENTKDDQPPTDRGGATYYAIGKFDAMAEVLMMVRLSGERQALRQISEQLNVIGGTAGHCHAKWYLENHPAVE